MSSNEDVAQSKIRKEMYKLFKKKRIGIVCIGNKIEVAIKTDSPSPRMGIGKG